MEASAITASSYVNDLLSKASEGSVNNGRHLPSPTNAPSHLPCPTANSNPLGSAQGSVSALPLSAVLEQTQILG